jgi:hypothetical protein
VVLLGLVSSLYAKKDSSETDEATAESQDDAVLEENTKYYTLIEKNLQPDKDEFYLNTIYKIKGKPKALISRSLNLRSSDLFHTFVEYGVGDSISEDFVIDDIDFFRKEVLVKQISTGKKYSLKLSYGDARSVLIPLDAPAEPSPQLGSIPAQ